MSANTNTQNAADTVTGAAEEVKEAAANAANKVAAPFKRSHWKSLVGDTMIVTGTVAVVGGVAYLGFRYIPRLFNRGE